MDQPDKPLYFGLNYSLRAGVGSAVSFSPVDGYGGGIEMATPFALHSCVYGYFMWFAMGIGSFVGSKPGICGY